MKRCAVAVLSALLMAATPIAASQGGPKVKPPKPPQASVSKPVKTTTTKVKPVSVTTSKSKAPKPVKATTVKTVKSTTKATKPAKTTKSAKADVKSTKKAATTTASTTTTPTTDKTTTVDPTTGETVPLTKVQEKLKRNTNLASKLEGRLPPGTDLMEACEGFKNLGQFVAAVNVSRNHEGITFTELKTLMVDEGYSLGQAMQKLKASSDGAVDAKLAEYEANRMITETERAPSAPTGVSATGSGTSSGSTTAAKTTTTTVAKTKTKKPKKVVGGQQ